MFDVLQSSALLAQSKHVIVACVFCSALLGCAPKTDVVEKADTLTSYPKAKANVIVILADDLGYTDVVAFSEKVSGIPRADQFFETPHIDSLADQGTAFTSAYVNPLCSPTRASLLTGKQAISLGFTTATSFRSTSYFAADQTPPEGFHPLDVIEHKDKITIPQAFINGRTITGLRSGTELDGGKDEITFAEVMNEHRNAFIGKWHLGGHGTPGYQPQNQGFEELSFFDGGASSFFNFQRMWNGERLFKDRQDQMQRMTGKWQSLDDSKPVKPYLTDALSDESETYLRARAKDGKPFTLLLSHFAVHAPIQGKQSYIDYFSKKATRGKKGQSNPTYAAMVKSLDDSVGQIINVLKETGLDENTYVVFMSDNGGVDWLMRGDETPPTSNAPFTGGKATVYEGGVRVPLVIWHSSMQQTEDVTTSVDITDLFPTLIELGGYDKSTYQKIAGLAGQSLTPFLTDPGNRTAHYTKDTIYWYYPFNVIVNSPKDGYPLTPHAAIKRGDYKLVVNFHGNASLYNVQQDMSESNDLSAAKPQLAGSLFEELVAWIDTNAAPQYLPLINGGYKPAEEVRDKPFQLLPTLSKVCCEVQLSETE